MARSIEDYASALSALLPQGRVWQIAQGSRQAALVNSLAKQWARIDAAGEDLLLKSLPGKNPDLLPDWEETLGISQQSNLTITQRAAQVRAKFIATGGQSKPFLIALAAAFGFTISIANYIPFRIDLNTVEDPLYDEGWASALKITIVANANGFDRSVLSAALNDIVAAHVTIILN
jgi:uncharacterized protein YmfQ (DUF2313 family)